MTGTALERTIAAYFDGINRERYAAVGRLFALEGVLVAPGTSDRRGPDEIAAYFAAALALYPVHVDTPTRAILAGRSATVEVRFTGATASGAEIAFDAVDVFDLDEAGQIARLSSWYDSHAVREQLRAARRRDG